MKKLKRWPALTGLFIVFAIMAVGLAACEQFGAIPKGVYLEEVEASPHYDLDRSIFVNRRPDILDTMNVGERFSQIPLARMSQIFYLIQITLSQKGLCLKYAIQICLPFSKVTRPSNLSG